MLFPADCKQSIRHTVNCHCLKFFLLNIHVAMEDNQTEIVFSILIAF